MRLQGGSRSGCLCSVCPESVVGTVTSIFLRRALRIRGGILIIGERCGHWLDGLSVALVCVVSLLLLKQCVSVRGGHRRGVSDGDKVAPVAWQGLDCRRAVWICVASGYKLHDYGLYLLS